MAKGDRDGAFGGGAYFLGFIGAIIYYFQHVHSASGFILGFLKALVWPAVLVYDVLRFLHG